MIIVLQSLPDILAELKRRAQQQLSIAQLENILFTNDRREALDCVLAQRDESKQTIVISSTMFYARGNDDYATDFLNAKILAATMKSIDQNVWFFTYSVSPQTSPYIDGAIPKDVPDMFAHALEFLAVDFAQIENLDALHLRLPWLA